MKNSKALCFALLLMLCVSLSLMAQEEPPLAIQVRQTIEEKEPGWRYIVAVESGRIPLVPSERRILAGQWVRQGKSVRRETIGIHIYRVESSSEAAKWLNPIRSEQVAAGWKVVEYSIGEEGYLSRYRDGKQFEIHLRTGNIVIRISGSNLDTIERFIKNVVSQMPAAGQAISARAHHSFSHCRNSIAAANVEKGLVLK
jgi:hypothetical protein